MAPRSPRCAHLLVVALGLLPAVGLLARFLFGDGLGADPIETITHSTGAWTLRLLLLTLAVTPARKILGWRRIAPFRRTLGLLAFGCACLHLATWLALDQLFDWQAMGEDVAKRRYITVGLAAFLCLVPLAATSSHRAVRRLGRRWVALHRLVYLAAVCDVVHYTWQVKADLRGPALYGATLAVLLAFRLAEARKRRGSRRATAPRR